MSGFDPDGRPTPGEVYAQSLLRRILAKHPENVAANHYWIHAVEGGPNPESGLASVAVLLRGAPHAGHIVHMGGHVAYRLGNYEQARKSFLDSLRVDEAYLAREHIPAQYDDNYAHNLSYLVAACAEAGRRQEASAGRKSSMGCRHPWLTPPARSTTRFPWAARCCACICAMPISPPPRKTTSTSAPVPAKATRRPGNISKACSSMPRRWRS